MGDKDTRGSMADHDACEIYLDDERSVRDLVA